MVQTKRPFVVNRGRFDGEMARLTLNHDALLECQPHPTFDHRPEFSQQIVHGWIAFDSVPNVSSRFPGDIGFRLESINKGLVEIIKLSLASKTIKLSEI